MLTHVVTMQFKGDAGLLQPGTFVDGDAMPNRDVLESERYMRRLTPAEFSKANADDAAAEPVPSAAPSAGRRASARR